MTIFERNIGVITAPQQETLRRSRVTVIGLGGLGGVIAEVLVRSGVGQLVLVDFDTFDRSNLNRQVFAFQDTVGRPKTEVTLEFLRRINPGLEAVLAATVDEDNGAALLAGSDAIVLAADDAVPCIIASRFARTAGIPVIEGWAIPFCNARVFTADTPTLEECYGFPPLPPAPGHPPRRDPHGPKTVHAGLLDQDRGRGRLLFTRRPGAHPGRSHPLLRPPGLVRGGADGRGDGEGPAAARHPEPRPRLLAL